MDTPRNFRSAFNGFNREDVVRYIEYMNAQHTAQINELNAELEFLRSKQAPVVDPSLEEKCRELEARCEALEQERDAAIAEKEAAVVIQSGAELEAYRRAERTERVARERAEQVYHRVNGVLSDATVKVDQATSQIGDMSEQFLARLDALRAAVDSSRQALNEAAQTMYALRPENEE